MTVVSRHGLITELLDRTELIKTSTFSFLRLTDEQLAYRPGEGKWSIGEIFGHLNVMHDNYIRAILSRVTLASDHPSDQYKSSWLGNWLYRRQMPRSDGSVIKLKAPRSLYPPTDLTEREHLENFQMNCDALDDILRHSATKDIRRIRIPLAGRQLIALRLGDVLRIMVAHSERHLLQAQRIMRQVSER